MWLTRGVGLYGIEQGPYGHFAWMKPDASIVLPQAEVRGKYKLAVTMVSHRPTEYPAEPQWVWNGMRVHPTRTGRGDAENVTIYYFDSVKFVDDADNVLRVITHEWIPARDSDIPDGRSLGLGFAGMEWGKNW